MLPRDLKAVKDQLVALAQVNRDKLNFSNALFYEEILTHFEKLEKESAEYRDKLKYEEYFARLSH